MTDEEKYEALRNQVNQMLFTRKKLDENLTFLTRQMMELAEKIEKEKADMKALERLMGDNQEEENQPLPPPHPKIEVTPPPIKVQTPNVQQHFPQQAPEREQKAERENERTEANIGKNVIGKAGIIIAVIGLIALLKYAYGNFHITDLTKVILGYIGSFVMLIFSFKEKKTKQLLSSGLLTGAVSFAYLWTFAGCFYFEIFGNITCSVITVSIAAFTCAVGFLYKNTGIINLAAVLMYISPLIYNIKIIENYPNGWCIFLILLSVTYCIFSIWRKNEWHIVTVLVINSINYILMLIADSEQSNYFFFIQFLIFFFGPTIFELLRKGEKPLLVPIVNTIFLILLTEFKLCPNYIYIFSATFIIQALVFKLKFAHEFYYKKYIIAGIYILNYALLHSYFHAETKYANCIFPLTILIESIAAFVASKVTKESLYEKISFILLFVNSFLLPILVTKYNFDGSYHYGNLKFGMFGFFLLCGYIAWAFIASKKYNQEKYKSFAYFATFAIAYITLVIESNFTTFFQNNIIFSLNLSLLYFSALLIFNNQMRYSETVRKISCFTLPVLQFLFATYTLYSINNHENTTTAIVFSIATMLFSMIVLTRFAKKTDNINLILVIHSIVMYIAIHETMHYLKDIPSIQLWITLGLTAYLGMMILNSIGGKFSEKVLKFVNCVSLLILLKFLSCDIITYLSNIQQDENNRYLIYGFTTIILSTVNILYFKISDYKKFETISFTYMIFGLTNFIFVIIYTQNVQNLSPLFNCAILLLLGYGLYCRLMSKLYNKTALKSTAYIFAIFTGYMILQIANYNNFNNEANLEFYNLMEPYDAFKKLQTPKQYMITISIDLTLAYFTILMLCSNKTKYPKITKNLGQVFIFISMFLFTIIALGNLNSGKLNTSIVCLSFALYLISMLAIAITDLGNFNTAKNVIINTFNLSIIIIEFIHLFNNYNNYQIWLSLLLATYAIILFVIGFRKHKKWMRHYGIVLSSITAIKIVTYDLWSYSLLTKAIVFILVGGIFILISYLYTKFFKEKQNF